MNGDYTANIISNGVNNPLAHLNDSVNSLDPLNAMEKSLNDQVNLKYFENVLFCLLNII